VIGLQDIVIKQNIKVPELANEIGIQPGTIWRWFLVNKIPKKYLDFLSIKFEVEKEYLVKQVNNIITYKPREKNYFNEYEIRGDITAIFLENKKGLRLETLIDTKKLEYIKALGYYWHLRYAPNTGTYYAQATIQVVKENGKRGAKSMYLHIEIVNPEHNKSIYVDHEDHDTLNNREDNLRKTINRKNLSHRSGANENNKTGVRNVCLVTRYGGKQLYLVQMMKSGKRYKWEFPVNEFKEACIFAEEMRQEIFGEFAGNG